MKDLVVGHAASYPFPNANGMYNDMAKAAKIVVTKVRCRKCGAEQTVNGAHCLANGWPECHGETMELVR